MSVQNDTIVIQQFIFDLCGSEGEFDENQDYSALLDQKMKVLGNECTSEIKMSINLDNLEEKWQTNSLVIYRLFYEKYSHFVNLKSVENYLADFNPQKEQESTLRYLKLLLFFLQIYEPDVISECLKKYEKYVSELRKILFKKDIDLCVLILQFFRNAPYQNVSKIVTKLLDNLNDNENLSEIIRQVVQVLLENHREEFVDKKVFIGGSFEKVRGEILSNMSKEQVNISFKIKEIEKTAQTFKDGYEEYSAKYLTELTKNVDLANTLRDLKKVRRLYDEEHENVIQLTNFSDECKGEIMRLNTQNKKLIDKFQIIEKIKLLCSDLVEKQKKRFIAERKVRDLNKQLINFEAKHNDLLSKYELLLKEKKEDSSKIEELKKLREEDMKNRRHEVVMSKKKLNEKLEVVVRQNKDLKSTIQQMEKRILSNFFDQDILSKCQKINDDLKLENEKLKHENAGLQETLKKQEKKYIQEPQQFVQEILQQKNNSVNHKKEMIENIENEILETEKEKIEKDDEKGNEDIIKEKQDHLEVLREELRVERDRTEQLTKTGETKSHIVLIKKFLNEKESKILALEKENEDLRRKFKTEKDKARSLSLFNEEIKEENVKNVRKIEKLKEEQKGDESINEKNEEIRRMLEKQVEIKNKECVALQNEKSNQSISKEIIDEWLSEKDRKIKDLQRELAISHTAVRQYSKKFMDVIKDIKGENIKNKETILVKQVEYFKEFDLVKERLKEIAGENNLLRDVLHKDFGGKMKLNELLLKSIVELKKNIIIEGKKMSILRKQITYIKNENTRLRDLIKKYIKNTSKKIKDDRNELKQNIRSKIMKMQKSLEGTNDEDYKRLLDEIQIDSIETSDSSDEDGEKHYEGEENEEGVLLMQNLEKQFIELEKMKTKTIV